MAAAQTVTVDGTDVHIEGSGEHTLVMIHGWPDTHVLWDAQVAHFSPHLRCVRFTLPGYKLKQGRRALTLQQMTAHIAAIINDVSPDQPVTLLLHDWGAFYGYQYVMQHPSRVARVVGVDIGDTRSGEFLRSLSIRAKLMMAAYQLWLALAYQLPAVVGTPMTRWMARLLHAPAQPQAIDAQMNYPYVALWSGGFRGAVRFKPPCPFLFLYGEIKPFMFHAGSWADRVAATAGNAVHGMQAGHWVMVNQPMAFNQIVADWLGLPATAA